MLMGKDDSADGTANVSWTLDAEVDTSKLLTIEGSGWDLRNRLNFTAYGGYMLYNLRIESEGEDLYVKSMDGHEGAGAPGTPSFVPYRRKCGYIEGNKIVLYFGFTKVHSGVIDNNMTVTFYAEGESRAERVTKARFGTMFGVGGNSDRLFVAGNPAHKNIDFYSESDDLTYFSDRASSAVGSGGSAIMGYGRISDNTLAIYKSDALHEPTVFYRTGSNREEYDENGVLSKITALFPTFGGSDGEGLVSNFASANLAGDPMILSKNGVFGIEPSENAAVPDRYTRERSRPIRKKLTAHMLSEAVGTVYENRYYLAVGGEMFIADPRYKYRGDDSAEVSYNYEWWVWDNCPVRVFANVWDFLGFGTEDGRVCVFDDEYTDRTFSKFEAGDLALDISAGSVTYNEVIGLSIKDGDLIEFQTQGIYGCLDDLITVENGRLCANEETILSLHDGMEVYADNVGDSGLYAEQAYFITDIDRGDMTYRLMDGMGVYINPTEGGFSLHRMLSSKPLYIAELGEEAFFVREYKEGAVIKLSGYNGSVPTTPIATVTHFEAVKAEWVTPVFDLGTTEYGKSLRRMTVTMSPEQNGRLSFGYETREARRLAAAAGIGSFSLEDLSFVDFSLDTGFAGSYSVPCCERQFNYILFRFISEDDRGCAVTGFTATYTITPIRTRGVR